MRKKMLLHIYQCHCGDVVAQDIFDENGILILPVNSIIDEHIIKQLSTFKIDYIQVLLKEGKQQDDSTTLKEFKGRYSEKISAIKELLGNLAAGRKLDFYKVDDITDKIYSEASSSHEIIECLNRVRNADEYTYAHSVNVSLYGMLISKWLGLPEIDIREIVKTGILHDIGKVKIPTSILNKKGPLLPEEYKKIKEHPFIGHKLASIDIPDLSDNIKEGILMHHERENGEGYPFGIKGSDINLYAKIISVADVYDALTSERSYKKRITPFDTFRELEKIGYGFFDAKIMMTFLSNITSYYIGARVRMENGDIGEVVYVAPQNISKPVIRVGKAYIDLTRDKQYAIAEML